MEMSVRIIAFKDDGMVNNKYYRWTSDTVSQLYDDQTGIFPLAMTSLNKILYVLWYV